MRYSTGNAPKLATGTGNVLVPTDPGTGPVPVRVPWYEHVGVLRGSERQREADDQCATIHSLSRLNEALIVCLIENHKRTRGTKQTRHETYKSPRKSNDRLSTSTAFTNM